MGDRLLLGWHLRYSIAKTTVDVVLGIMYRKTPSFFQSSVTKKLHNVTA